MNKYLPIFKDIFSSIIFQYKFGVKCVDDETILLFKMDFELEFLMWREATDLSFNLLLSKTTIKKIILSDYIVSNMIAQDRFIEETTRISNLVYDRNIRELKYYANVLSRSFSEMLSGGRKWLYDYNNSPYFIEPRILERR